MKIDDEYIRNATENAKRLRCIWEKTRLDQEEQFQRNQSLAQSEARKKKILSTFENLVCIAITCFVLVFGVKHFFLDDGQKQDSVAQNTSGVETSVNKEETINDLKNKSDDNAKNSENTNSTLEKVDANANVEYDGEKSSKKEEIKERPKIFVKEKWLKEAITESTKIVESVGLNADIKATTYGKYPDGCLIRSHYSGEGENDLVIDYKNNRIAIYKGNISRAYDYSGSQEVGEPIQIQLWVLDDSHDSDARLGVWKGNTHVFRVKVTLKEDTNGSIVIAGMSGGESEFGGRTYFDVREQKNYDLVQIILNQYKELMNIRSDFLRNRNYKHLL